ncbi:MAG: HEAT repeat domain-containing protein [Dehalococcoidia bacterium]|nr:HEAT repeat domain-containing protein [Dehalococcoidia bacterium]
MSEFNAAAWSEACRGLEGVEATSMAAGAGALADRQPFALPGDRPVWGRNRPLRIEHLRLEFSFDLKQRRVDGVAALTFHPRADAVREAVFDAIDLDVSAVTDEAGRDLKFALGERTLTVDLGRSRRQGQSTTVVVTYTATPRRGLYFNQPEQAYPDRPVQVWTQGQAEDSAHYFPCFDFPGEKFTTEMLITVPNTWTAISNGRLDAVAEDRRRRTKTFHWKQERPHPAYLVTLVAGEFDEVTADAGGVPVQYYGQPGSSDDLQRAFGRTPKMIEYFAEKIGVPYPWAKYATVAVHDFIFGGMENTSATTMTDTLLHDQRAHADFVEQADSITAHELAHQWFGDLLTCREWSHGWLNESFATYFDALFVEAHRGWDAFRYNVLQNGQIYLQEDGGDYRRPLVQNVFTEPIDVFDRHLYERGSVVLDMLRHRLGDDLWWRAINHYVTKHQESEVLTPDLQRAIEEATGYNLDGFFAQWVWKGGHPEFKATTSWDGQKKLATVTLQQTQKPDETLTSVYEAPMEVGFWVNGRFDRRTFEVVDGHETFVVSLAAAPEFISIDPANRVLKTLDYSPGEQALKANLTQNPEAVGRIDAAKGLAKVGSPGAVAALRASLLDRQETDFVRAEAATALGKVKSEAARDALVAGTKERDARVRRASAAALGNFRDETAAAALTRLLAGEGDRSYYVQAAAATALGKTLQSEAFGTLTGVLGREAHNDVITAGALAGLGASRDERAASVLLEHTQWGVHQNARRSAAAALGDLHRWLTAPDRTRVRERLEELLDDPWLRVQTTAATALLAVAAPESVSALRAASERALDGRMKRLCKVAAKRISEKAEKPEEVNALRKQVEELQQSNQKLEDRLVALEARLDKPARRRK